MTAAAWLCPFAIEDLFTAGLGLDIAGAYLLARAVNTSSEVIAASSATVYGSNTYLLVKQVEDKVDGKSGLVALVSGFVVQVCAYIVTLSSPELSASGFGLASALFAALSAVCSGVIALALWAFLRRPLRRRELVELARVSKSFTREPRPYAATLLRFGKALGQEPRTDETESAYAKRVWNVDAIAEGEPLS